MEKSGAQFLSDQNGGYGVDVDFIRKYGGLIELRRLLQKLRGISRSEKEQMLSQVLPFIRVFGGRIDTSRDNIEALRMSIDSVKPNGATRTATAYLAWLCHYHSEEGGEAQKFYAETGLDKVCGGRLRPFVGNPEDAYKAKADHVSTQPSRPVASRARISREARDWEIALHRIASERRLRSGYLSLGKLRIDSIPESVYDLPWLTRLNISGTFIADLWRLERLEHLTLLDCSYSPITSLEGVAKCTSLAALFCGESHISDISPLSELSAMTALYCGSSLIESLAPLSKLLRLETLHCEDTMIKDLSGLEGLGALRFVDCQDTDITGLDELKECISLRTLILNGCHLERRMDSVWELPSLEEVIFARGTLKGVPGDRLSRNSDESCLPRLLAYLKRNPISQ